MFSLLLRVFRFIAAATLVATGALPPLAKGAAANSLSSANVRALVGVGDQALHTSFTIEGTTPKSVLVRAVGPALATFGVTGTLADPMLRVYNGAGVVVASNDNWAGTSELMVAFMNAGVFPLPAGSRDAALVTTLPPGTYTVRVSGVNDTTGIALAEVYENDSLSRIAYNAVRQRVGTGQDVLIAGIVVNGPASQRVLVRALGPALGITGALADPMLMISDVTGRTIGSNDNWSGSEVATAAATAGLMPLTAGSTDAALVMTLAPGSYLVQVVGNNGVTGIGQSEIALLDGRTGTAPPALVTVPGAVSAAQGGSITLAATNVGKPAVSYQWQKSGASIAGATGSSYTIPAVNSSSAGNYTVVLTNSAGTLTSQPWTVGTGQGPVLPVITTEPDSREVQQGEAATFSVAATGPGPLTFQWSKDGVAIPNDVSRIHAVRNFAESSSLTVFDATSSSAGNYTVTVTNSNGATTSRPAVITVIPPRVAPTIAAQPSDLVVTTGDTAQLRVTAGGSPAPTYQWFKDGQPVAGGTSATLAIANARVIDGGAYFVVVTNAAGSVMSRTVALTVSNTPLAPTIVTPPASLEVALGLSARFAVTASGTSPLSYQWRKDGVAIAGATASSYFIAAGNAAHAGSYTVTVTNAVGTVTSVPAVLAISGSHGPAAYFGTLGTAGTFALHVTDTNSGVFLGYISATRTPIVQRAIAIGSDGRFTFPATAGAVVTGTIRGDGSIIGEISGLGLTLTGARASGGVTTRGVAGFYQAGEVNGAGVTYAIVAPSGLSYVLAVTPTTADAGIGSVDANGRLAATAGDNGTIAGNVNAGASTLTASVTLAGGGAREFVGGSDARPVTEKLVNISTRGRVGVGADVLIAGFVVSGDAPKQILVRAIGPTLASFGVSGALANPKLDVTSNGQTIATNTAWRTAADVPGIIAATTRAGGFSLTATSNDSVLLLTLPPGGYTAVVSGVNDSTGVALVEVYDVSENATPARKVINLSARAVAGPGDDTLIAGCNISGTLPKRVLVRAVGPTLASAFSVPGTLGDPQLRIVRAADQVVVATNDNWSDGAGVAQIASASATVGAFALAPNSRDAALLIHLPPGGYSVVVTGSGTASGVALVEVYEVP